MTTQEILDIYEQFVFKTLPHYNTVSIHSREITLLTKFTKQNQKELSIRWVTTYIGFQFYYWSQKETRSNNKRYPLSWIFGKKATERFDQRNDIERFYTDKFNNDLGFLTGEQYENHFFDNTVINKHEESIKKTNFNTAHGFINCIDQTTLHNPRSPLCMRCKYSMQCKRLLSNNYPLIYEIRNATKKNAVK